MRSSTCQYVFKSLNDLETRPWAPRRPARIIAPRNLLRVSPIRRGGSTNSATLRVLDSAITKDELLLTPRYWQLGQVLELARRQFTHRQWGTFLASLAIDPTRASKARAIHGTFGSVEEVADLSVKEAYQRRQRKRPRAPRPVSRSAASAPAVNLAHFDAEPQINLVQCFVEICRNAELCRFVAESVAAEDAAACLTALDEAMSELAKLHAFLSRQAISN